MDLNHQNTRTIPEQQSIGNVDAIDANGRIGYAGAHATRGQSSAHEGIDGGGSPANMVNDSSRTLRAAGLLVSNRSDVSQPLKLIAAVML